MEKTSEKDLLQRMQRDINCLLDQDDYMRKNALKALIQKFKADDTHKGIDQFAI